ncbi:hypothetical protein [Roseisolibacter agri]|uniref:Uncharacterized protein n=1 Tax=Roseisolibacter agri TaxID=2014610 RepID=A0AA37QG71_9BACT|nr:hypothetical protein [Roseisolibacter agri]GLC28311.1 hypothetical protein rosag_48240 [Roseisolibacter agri]
MGGTLTVVTGRCDSITDCEVALVRGRAHLVFADSLADTPLLATGRCGGTQPADEAAAAIATLSPAAMTSARAQGGAADSRGIDGRVPRHIMPRGFAGDCTMVVPPVITGPATLPLPEPPRPKAKRP